MKTQLRFGKVDIEVYTKVKGEETGYRKVDLDDFTDMRAVPSFNYGMKWKRYVDKPPRRATNNWEDLGPRPSVMGQPIKNRNVTKTRKDNEPDREREQEKTDDPSSGKNPMVRANSNSNEIRNKKQKYSAVSSEEEDCQMEDENEEEEEDEDIQHYSTPAGGNQ